MCAINTHSRQNQYHPTSRPPMVASNLQPIHFSIIRYVSDKAVRIKHSSCVRACVFCVLVPNKTIFSSHTHRDHLHRVLYMYISSGPYRYLVCASYASVRHTNPGGRRQHTKKQHASVCVCAKRISTR